ncbi:MAG: hypothetical protein Q7T05_00710 [Dehalococcoidia bacterium]|nr:hypothetical protein [Dehalococcoidia bacterium]
MAGIAGISAFVKKKAGLNVGYYLTNTSVLTLSKLGGLVLSFATVYLFTHFSTKEAYGKYTFVFSMLDLLSILCLPGMATAISQSVARGFLGTLGYASAYRLRFSLLGSLALVGASRLFGSLLPGAMCESTREHPR